MEKSLFGSSIAGKTYYFDLFRGGFYGVVETGIQTYCLFIAIRYFNAGSDVKSIIAAAPWMGMILSLFVVHIVSSSGARKALCGAVPAMLASVCLFLSAWTENLIVFTALSFLAYLSLSVLIPFLTSIYSDNYPPDKRGQFLANSIRTLVVTSILFGFAASALLDIDLGNRVWVFSTIGLCAFAMAWSIHSMPSTPIEPGYPNPFTHFKYLVEDRSFGYILLTWFIMGFANLWIQPLRVDYLTSSRWGIEASATMVTFIITILPNLMRLVFTPLWGKLFDRINFVVLRIILNLCFAVGVGLFFLSRNIYVIGTGAAFIGLAFAGGSIAWSLWITKYAPPGKATSYMSIHVFLTGLRGTFGPMIGFWTVERVGPVGMSLISSGMMAIATLMLLPEIRRARH